MAKHDENKDVKLLSKIAKIDTIRKTIQVARTQIIGNKRWGRLDYLTHYCGYTLIWSTAGQIAAFNAKSSNDDETIVKEKKEAHKLSNKNSKTSKKK